MKPDVLAPPRSRRSVSQSSADAYEAPDPYIRALHNVLRMQHVEVADNVHEAQLVLFGSSLLEDGITLRWIPEALELYLLKTDSTIRTLFAAC